MPAVDKFSIACAPESAAEIRQAIASGADHASERLRGLLLAGASSAPKKAVDKAYLDGLRARAKRRPAE